VVERRHRQRRRWWWAVAAGGLAGTGAAAVWLVRVLPGYLHQPLDRQVAQASVVGMFLTAAGLLVSAGALATAVVQLRRPDPGPQGDGRPPPFSSGQPSVTSLAPPIGLLDGPVRGRGDLIEELVRSCRRRRWARWSASHFPDS
jgi:hypothetical protein